MLLSNNPAIAPFASMSELQAAAPRGRAWVRWFCMSPFRDIDDRAAHLAAGRKAAKAAREAAMNAASGR
ncbi:MAG TPA: hypothetical protein VET89_07365 [Stellaceae bacterium]|jgi:hypothetical protein|nr:hypothetical protein [Stellaceae bacterium]